MDKLGTHVRDRAADADQASGAERRPAADRHYRRHSRQRGLHRGERHVPAPAAVSPRRAAAADLSPAAGNHRLQLGQSADAARVRPVPRASPTPRARRRASGPRSAPSPATASPRRFRRDASPPAFSASSGVTRSSAASSPRRRSRRTRSWSSSGMACGRAGTAPIRPRSAARSSSIASRTSSWASCPPASSRPWRHPRCGRR